MANDLDGAKERAEARFKKAQQRATEGEKAKAEHDAKVLAVDANTARLKALRLDKERVDRETAAAAAAETQVKPKRVRSSKSAAP